jgi:general secretion pathway protein C
MGLDAQLKRWWWVVVASMTALTALCQAAGVGRMVAAALAGSEPASAPQLPPAKAPANREKDRNGLAILARNIFDSQTGPLDGSAQPAVTASASTEPSPVEAPPLADLSEDAPPCDVGRVVLISASDDPNWSFAAIEDGGGKTQLRRNGQEIAGYTVRAMAWNRVWLEQAGKQCQLKLGDKSKGAAPKPAASGAPKEPPPATPGNGGLSPELAAKIHKVSDTEFNVERSVIDEILENQAELMKTARIVPDKQGDKVMGIRLFGIRSGTLLSTLGLKNGDRLESINGFDMSDPQKALEAYGRLRTADALKVKVNRGGTPLNIDFKIQ